MITGIRILFLYMCVSCTDTCTVNLASSTYFSSSSVDTLTINIFLLEEDCIQVWVEPLAYHTSAGRPIHLQKHISVDIFADTQT